jgi:hypothetical protein
MYLSQRGHSDEAAAMFKAGIDARGKDAEGRAGLDNLNAAAIFSGRWWAAFAQLLEDAMIPRNATLNRAHRLSISDQLGTRLEYLLSDDFGVIARPSTDG